MTLAEILSRLRARESEIRAEGVARLAVFGSRARGDARPDSDVDLLVSIAPGARFSLLNLSGVGLIAEEATGLRSTVVVDRQLDPAFKSGR